MQSIVKIAACSIIVWSFSGCRAQSQERAERAKMAATGKLFYTPPEIRSNPIKRVPLVAIVDIDATTDVTPTILVDDGQRQWEQPWPVEAANRHRIAVMGMKPDRLHKIRIRLTAADGTTQTSEPLEFHTPPLPRNFPPLKVVKSDPDRMEPGLTFFAVNIWEERSSILNYGFILAIDELGEVVWFCDTGDRIADMRILSNGNILYQHGNYRYAYEIDILGRDIKRWVSSNLTVVPEDASVPVKIDTTHHDIIELPNGNLATLATELNKIEAFPTSEFDPEAPWEPAHVVCDAVVEFDRDTGKIVDRFELRKILDPKRFGYISLGSFWKDKYNHRINDLSRDWSHANALVYLEDEDAMLVSFRHLDCIYKLNWKTKEIIWILGNHGGWAAEFQKYLLKPKDEDFAWFYHQHSPQMTPHGTLMLYDNGNYRARPFKKAILAPQNRSRVLELRIDEESRTFETVFEYDGGEENRFYCPFYCEADSLPVTQNILVTDGGHVELADGTPNDDVPGERQWARIFEITRGPVPERVFEIKFDSGIGSKYGWSIYRAMRIANLYTRFRIDPPAVGEDVSLIRRARHQKRMDY